MRVRASASIVEEAVDEVHGALLDGRIEQEPDFTSRMLQSIELAVNGRTVNGLRWSAKVLTDRGPGSQEKQYGADFIGVLEIAVPGYRVRKGFLAQAKLSKSSNMSRAEFDRMIDQCKVMLELSPSSFVFQYTHEGIRVIPTLAVLAASGPEVIFNPDGLYSRRIRTFYEQHIECFIGDMRISEPTEHTLAELRARHLLYRAARSE